MVTYLAVVNPVDAPATAEVTPPPAIEESGGGGVKGNSGVLNTFAYSCADSVVWRGSVSREPKNPRTQEFLGISGSWSPSFLFPETRESRLQKPWAQKELQNICCS